MAEVCPYCGVTAETPTDEVEHMSSAHPEVVEARLRREGLLPPEGHDGQ